jgi:hypothetical protein
VIHVLLGAAIGSVIGVAATVVAAKLTGQKITWKRLTAAAIGGALGGAVTAATLGVAGPAAASASRLLVATTIGGSLSGGTEQVTNNALGKRPLQENVIKSAAVAGATGAIFGQAERAIAPLVVKAAPALTEISEKGGQAAWAARELGKRTNRKVTEWTVKTAISNVHPSNSSTPDEPPPAPPPAAPTRGLVGALEPVR